MSFPWLTRYLILRFAPNSNSKRTQSSWPWDEAAYIGVHDPFVKNEIKNMKKFRMCDKMIFHDKKQSI